MSAACCVLLVACAAQALRALRAHARVLSVYIYVMIIYIGYFESIHSIIEVLMQGVGIPSTDLREDGMEALLGSGISTLYEGWE